MPRSPGYFAPTSIPCWLLMGRNIGGRAVPALKSSSARFSPKTLPGPTSNAPFETCELQDYFRPKTKTLKSFVKFLRDTHGGSLTRLFASPKPVLRDQLLSLRGIGPETV